MSKSFLAVCFSGFMIAQSAFGDGPSVNFSLEGWGREIVVGEPLVLAGRVINLGPKEVKLPLILDPSFRFARYWISYEEGVPQAFVPYLSFDGRAVLQSLAPGKEYKGNVPLFCGADGYVFARSGKYQITGEFQGVKSPPLTVMVRPPSGPLESCISAAFSSRDVCQFILLKGGESFKSVPSPDVCRVDLLKSNREFKSVPDFLDKVLQSGVGFISSFSFYARYALAEYYSSDGMALGGIRPADRDRVVSLIDEQGLLNASLPDYYRIRLFDRLIAAEAGRKEGKAASKHFQDFYNTFGRDDRAQISIRNSARLLGLEDFPEDPVEKREGIPFSAGGLMTKDLSDGCSLASVVSSPSSGTITGPRSKIKYIFSINLTKSSDPIIEGGKLILRARANNPPGINLVEPSDGIVVLSATISGVRVKVGRGLIKVDARGLPRGFVAQPQEVHVRLKLKIPCSYGGDFPWEETRLVPIVNAPGSAMNIKFKLETSGEWSTRIEGIEVEEKINIIPETRFHPENDVGVGEDQGERGRGVLRARFHPNSEA
jgi:hypothetical protein